MKIFVSIIFATFLAGVLNSQVPLQQGDTAPEINITDYLLNAPQDKSLDNKFIILEFWATWCAPCLASVPHLNELQNEFKDRKDLIFLSMTYEKPEKAKRTLEKIKFESVVVSDQTKETEKNYNVKGIPHTVLIDNQGIVQWIGTPEKLNSSLIEDFLNGKIIAVGERKFEVKEEKEVPENVIITTSESALKLLKDKNTKYLITLINADPSDPIMTMDMLALGRYIDQNNNLKSMLSRIIKKPETHILIPEMFTENKYNLIYKNANIMEVDAHLKVIKSIVLSSLNLTEKIENRKVEEYSLKINDADKLIVSINQNEDSHNGQNDTHLIFSNSKMETVTKVFGNHYGIFITDETGLAKNVDLLLSKGDLDLLKKELMDYGLTIESKMKEIEFYIYESEGK